MKKKSDDPSAFIHSRLVLVLLVSIAGVLLAMFTSALAQPRSAKRAPKVAQQANVKPIFQRPDQAFWAQTNGPQGGDGIALATSPSGHIFVGTQGGGVFRSTDDGGTWMGASVGITDTNVRALAINSASHIFTGTFTGVFRSTD